MKKRRPKKPARKAKTAPKSAARTMVLDLDNGNPIADLVKLTGRDAYQVNKWANTGQVVRVKRGTYDIPESIKKIIATLGEQAAGRMGQDGSTDAVRANAQFKDSQRKLNELKAAQIEGRMIAIEDVEEAWGALVTSTQELILTIPGRIRFDLPHLTGADQQVIDRTVRDMLEETAIEGAPRIPTGQRDITTEVEVEDDEDVQGVEG